MNVKISKNQHVNATKQFFKMEKKYFSYPTYNFIFLALEKNSENGKEYRTVKKYQSLY